ncbi:protein containing DUF433 [sediment metagenome]|uniref:Protein containing DUF433 n=1 Tax=sediment metagenome TaxID=749907 RepID=D9PF31_9ZZZZ
MINRIQIDSEIQHGKPVITGTRIPITRIVGGLAGGMTNEEIKSEYGISDQDIYACLEYANELIEKEEFLSIQA